MKRMIVFLLGMLFGVVWISGVPTLAQNPPAPPPSCEEDLNNQSYQLGGTIQQLAVVRAQLRAVIKERDDARAMVLKLEKK